jgi:uncharacterized lipoprotein YajG
MKTLTLIAAALLLTGCSSTNISKLVNAMSTNSSIVMGKVTSIYGTATIIRVGGTTNQVTVSPDGTITVNK